MPNAPLYFDYAATTPVDDRVIETMLTCLGRQVNFGNPASSGHVYGQSARDSVEQARRQVAERVGAHADELVWTSGATESNNLALKGIAQGIGQPGHLITSSWNTRPCSIPSTNWNAKAGQSPAWHRTLPA